MTNIFSSEPLPVAPRSQDPEVDAFNRKVLDYLRRLSAKIGRYLENGPSAGTLLTFAGYFSTNEALGPAYSYVTWNKELRKDSCYAHSNSVNSQQIQVLEDGLYIVMLDLEISDSSIFPLTGSLCLTLGVNRGSVNYGFGSLAAHGTLSLAIPLPLIDGVIIDMTIKDSSAVPGNNILAEGSRISIIKVSDDSTGWTGTSTDLPTDWTSFVASPV